MKPLILILLSATLAWTQPFSFGVKGGVPLTDFFSVAENGGLENPSAFVTYSTATNRYIIGPVVELRLPFGLGIEADALYRHLNYQSSSTLVDVLQTSQTTAGSWEFPILLKYRFPSKIVRPYVDGGVAFDTLSGLKQTVTNTLFPSQTTTTTSTGSPPELQHTTTEGFVLGGGLDIHILLHFSPEIRYTRWGSAQFSVPGLASLFHSNQNQAEFLLGITF
jgi:hypothetical protein